MSFAPDGGEEDRFFTKHGWFRRSIAPAVGRRLGGLPERWPDGVWGTCRRGGRTVFGGLAGETVGRRMGDLPEMRSGGAVILLGRLRRGRIPRLRDRRLHSRIPTSSGCRGILRLHFVWRTGRFGPAHRRGVGGRDQNRPERRRYGPDIALARNFKEYLR